MDTNLKLGIVIPAYNEESTISSVVEKLNQVITSLNYISEYTIVVVDDGSKDSTRQEAENLQNTIVLSSGYNMGIGHAVRTGLQFVEKRNFDLVLKIDADFQHEISEIPMILDPLITKNADLVYGDRFSGSIEYKMPKFRKIGNRFFTKLMSYITKYDISDSQPGLFAGNNLFLKSVSIFSDYNYTQQVLYSSHLAGLRFTQVPITFKKRLHGESFVKLSYPFKALFQIFILVLTKNPMRIFGFLAFLFLSFATTVALIDLNSYFLGLSQKPIDKVNLVLGFGLVGFQLLFTGIILKSISNIESYIRK